MERILVSACLLGAPVRFDGGAKTRTSGLLDRWKAEGRLVAICPEVEGGLGVPRPPAEIAAGTGLAVLQAEARVLTRNGHDVTTAFVEGAHRALELAREHGIRIAILKARSPSCGSAAIYDGSFSGRLREGEGVTAALLRREGIEVFSEEDLASVEQRLVALDGSNRRVP